jgi:hypothetical protein
VAQNNPGETAFTALVGTSAANNLSTPLDPNNAFVRGDGQGPSVFAKVDCPAGARAGRN